MIKPKRIRKRKLLIDALYIYYKELINLSPNSCVGVNDTYLNLLILRAHAKKITDKHFWNIITKYENYERALLYSNNKNITTHYQLMSLRDIFYLMHIIDYKPFSIATFIRTNITEEELEEKISKVSKENESNNKVKQKLKTPTVE